MDQKEDKPEISHLLVRELQAPLVSALVKGFAREIGEEQALEITKRVVREDAILFGKTLAQKFSGNSLEVLLEIIQEVWAEDGTMKIENISLNEKTLSFDVTQCGYAEMYQRLNIQELGSLMSCSRDFAFMDGFNPAIELRRNKTIMDGDSICNFCYIMK